MNAALAFTISVAIAVPVIAAGSADRRQQVPLTETIQKQIDGRGGLAWSSAHHLSWDDFKGAIPETVTEEAAHLEYGLFYGVRCTGRTFEFKVTAAMLPGDSWVRRSVLVSDADNARTLQHEQTHFNLTEVHAQKMRRYFAAVYEPCLRSSEDLDAMAERFVKAEADEQRSYDEETRNGRNPDRQKRWDADVAARLTAPR